MRRGFSARRKRVRGWWGCLSNNTKAFIAALVGGLLLAILSGPLGPVLSDFGSWLNPFERSKHRPRVTVMLHDQGVTHGWIVPKQFEQIGPLPERSAEDSWDQTAWDGWLKREGAVRAEMMSLGIALQGGSAKAVLITRLDIEIVARSEPLPGTHVLEFGAGGVPSRYFAVDLDHPGGPEIQAYAPSPGVPPNAANLVARPVLWLV